MKTTSITKKLCHEFDIYCIGGEITLCDPTDQKAVFLTSGWLYPKLIKNLVARLIDDGYARGLILPPMRWHVTVDTSRFGLPKYFTVTPVLSN